MEFTQPAVLCMCSVRTMNKTDVSSDSTEADQIGDAVFRFEDVTKDTQIQVTDMRRKRQEMGNICGRSGRMTTSRKLITDKLFEENRTQQKNRPCLCDLYIFFIRLCLQCVMM